VWLELRVPLVVRVVAVVQVEVEPIKLGALMVAGRNITDLVVLAQFVLLAPVLPVYFHLLV
jgi:hypothetical protein